MCAWRFCVVVFRSALGLAPFFPASLLGFQALKYLYDVPAKFITICGGECAQNMNFTKHGNFQSPHIKLLAQMQPGSMFHL